MEIILFSSKMPFNNNIAILESKIIYFCLRSNFRGSTTLRMKHKIIQMTATAGLTVPH